MNKNTYHNKLILDLRALKYVHAVIMVGCFAFVWMRWYQPRFHSYNATLFNIAAIITYTVLYIVFIRIYRGYEIGMRKQGEIMLSQFLSLLMAMFVMYFVNVAAWWRYFHFRTVLPMVVAFLVQYIISVVWTRLSTTWYMKRIQPRKGVVIYHEARDLKRFADFGEFGKHFTVDEYIQVEDNNDESVVEKVLGYDIVFVAGIDAHLRNEIVKLCVSKGITTYIVPSIGDIIVSGAKHEQQFPAAVMRVSIIKNNPEYFIAKRLFDLLMSLIAIIILSPILAVIAICVKAEDGGPALYKQTRLTRNGKEFQVLKFRSMKVNAESDGVARLAAENDSRITKTGAVLRKYRLDELPQLFNIFVGDMSIVGPRPERPEIAKQYKEVIPDFDLRLQVKAGLTGYAQVYGRYNTDPYDKLEMDLVYINKMDIFLDLELMFATVASLFSKDSAHGVDKGNVTAVDAEEKTVA